MDLLNGFVTYVIPFLIVLTVLVFVHELGHYWVARRNGVRVEVFSIGFGNELFGWTDRAGTRWRFSAVPLGGYVKMYGDADATSAPDASVKEMTDEQRAVSFHHKRVGQRAAIVVAGPAANFLFAIVAFAVIYVFVGQPFTPADVGGVLPGSAAERAGIQPGDRIVEINGESIERFEDILRIVQLNLTQPLEITVDRDGQELSITATPTVVEETDRSGNTHRFARLGISRPGIEIRQHPPLEALWRATLETWTQTTGTLRAVGQMLSGRRSSDEVGGMFTIGQQAGEVVRNGGVIGLVIFMAVLSINLGLINLFPVPMLDGGHLVFYAAEAVRGRPLSLQAQEYGFRIGLVLVFSLMLFATWNDLVRLRVVQYLVGLVS
ncbi:MAG: RIP metalloprotease RseP [Alphaproteobacteria bacterium]|nr:RIP metalloprotease RseP [Alphaproteobacteria bacterium]